MKSLSRVLIVSAAVVVMAVPASAQTAGHDHATAPSQGGPAAQAQAIGNQQAMMARMQAAQKKLDDLVAQMNAATESEKVDRMAAVITEMAAMHKDMCAQMMDGDMMSMMQKKMTDVR